MEKEKVKEDIILVGEGDYKFLSTIEEIRFKEYGIEYKSVEQYFQSKKFERTNPEVSKEIIKTLNSSDIIWMGKSSEKLRPDWDSIKYEIMYTANLLKFEQNEECRKKLINTGNKRIAQLSDQEVYWSESYRNQGESYTNQGANLLGKILMDIREKLKSTK